HGLARDECVRRRAVVELHEERRAQRVAPVVGHEMSVADDALTEISDVALLVRQQGAPRGVRPRLVPAIDRPLGRLRAVVVPQRLPAQSISRIARQISGHVSLDRPAPSFSLMFAALMIGHHFSISAVWYAASASGVCCSRGNISWPRFASRARTFGSASASTTAALSLLMTVLGVAFGANSANHPEM